MDDSTLSRIDIINLVENAQAYLANGDTFFQGDDECTVLANFGTCITYLWPAASNMEYTLPFDIESDDDFELWQDIRLDP